MAVEDQRRACVVWKTQAANPNLGGGGAIVNALWSRLPSAGGGAGRSGWSPLVIVPENSSRIPPGSAHPARAHRRWDNWGSGVASAPPAGCGVGKLYRLRDTCPRQLRGRHMRSSSALGWGKNDPVNTRRHHEASVLSLPNKPFGILTPS